jgi:hypothetical protein
MASEDITRVAFDPRKRYASVRMQAGRVLLDDDFNEAERISDEDERRARIEIVGPSGTSNDGFAISNGRLNALGEMTFDIGAGSYYLGGLRLENPAVETYALQDDWLQQPASERAVPPNGRIDLVYLETWQQPVSAVEDSELFEAGLAGPDTAARVRAMWRVHVAEAARGTDCPGAWAALLASWQAAHLGTLDETFERVVDAELSVDPAASGTGGDLCSPAIAGGYLGAENQAIRVELVDATHFTWGFDNAAPLYRCRVSGDRVTVILDTEPKDQEHWPLAGQIVEILPWSAVLPNNEKLAETSGHLSRVAGSYDPDTRELVLATPISATPPFGEDWLGREDHAELGPKFFYLRVWNRGDDLASPPAIPFVAGTPVTLGATGLDITFTGSDFVTGDHWIIAARPDTPQRIVPWQLEVKRGPHGIRRWFTPLALVQWHLNGGLGFDVLHDCRPTFQPLTRIRGCCTVTVGDGLHSFGKFTSIQKAIDSLPLDGGKVCILPGSYTEQVTIRKRRNITIEGCGARSVLHPPRNPTDVAIQIFGSQDIEIRSLAIDAGEHFAITMFDREAAPPVGTPPPPETTPLARGQRTPGKPILERVTIDDVRFTLGGLAAVAAVGGRWITIRRCTIASTALARPIAKDSDLGKWPSLWLQSLDVVVEDNDITCVTTELFTRTAMGGLQLAGGTERAEVRHNRIAAGTGDGVTLGSWTVVAVIIEGPADPRVFWVAPGWHFFINNEGCLSVDWDPVPPQDPGGGTLTATSMGLVVDIRIVDNTIARMGRSGVGVARFFDLTAQDEFITTDRITIESNRIRRCIQLPVSALPKPMTDLAAQGAITLADGEMIEILDNEITGNGKGHFDPICGVFMLRSNGMVIDDNRIVDNAPRVDTTDPVRPGWRGGIVLPSARPPIVAIDVPESPTPLLRQNGVPAARIHGNVIVVPEGRAICIIADGTVVIEDNELTSRGPALSRVTNVGSNPPLTTALDSIGGTIAVVGNLGISAEAGQQKLVSVNASPHLTIDVDGSALRPGLASLPQIAAGGVTKFDDNQCFLDLLERRGDAVPSAVYLVTFDDLSVQDNQIICDLGRGDVLVRNLFTFAWSQRVSGNRFQENASIQAVSAMTNSIAMNTTVDNQSTHCLMVLGMVPALVLDVGNLVVTQPGSDRCHFARAAVDNIRATIDPSLHP